MSSGVDQVRGASTWMQTFDEMALYDEEPHVQVKQDEQKAEGEINFDLQPDSTFLELPRGMHVNEKVGKQLAKFTQLNTLKITSFPNLELSGLKEIPTIKMLIFRTTNDHVRSEGVPKEGQKAYVYLHNFPDVVKYCPSLEFLDIGRNHRLGTELGSETDFHHKCGKVVTISGDCSGPISSALGLGIVESGVCAVSCGGADPLVREIAKLRNLRLLSLHEFPCWAHEFTARSISALSTLTNLRSFSLFGMMRSKNSPAAIEQVIRQFPQLETFQFELPVVADDKPMGEVYKKLPALQNLTNLLIEEPTLHPKLLCDLPGCKKLTHLTITHATAKESASVTLLQTIDLLCRQGLKSLTVQYLKGSDKTLVEKQIKELSSYPTLIVLGREQKEITTVSYDTKLECIVM